MTDIPELDASTARLRALHEARLFAEARGLAHRIAAELPEPSPRETIAGLRARADLSRALALVGEGRWARMRNERTLAAAQRALSPKHAEVATLLLLHAEILSQVVYYPELEPHLKRAVAIREEALGPDHPDTARALLDWAELCVRHWHAYLARPLARRARAVLEPLSGSLDPEVLRARELLALAGKGTAPPARIAAELADLAHLRERVQGAWHLDLARTLEPAIELEPVVEEAARLYQRVREILVRALDGAHPRVAGIDALMAERWMRAGDGARALPLLTGALNALEAAWQVDHPERMPVYGRITMLLVWAEADPEIAAFKERLRALKDLEKK